MTERTRDEELALLLCEYDDRLPARPRTLTAEEEERRKQRRELLSKRGVQIAILAAAPFIAIVAGWIIGTVVAHFTP